MIRFLALIGTGLISLLLLATTAVANHGHVPLVSNLIRRLLPLDTGFAASNALAFWLLQLSCFFLLTWFLRTQFRMHLHKPESRGRHRDWWASPLADYLTNPAKGWPMPFAFLLLAAVAFTVPLALRGQMSPAAWGLAALLTLVLLESAVAPDKPERLLAPDERDDRHAASGTEPAEPA